MFAMEMGGSASENAHHVSLHLQQPNYDRSVSAPSVGATEEQAKEEQRHADTEALKRMLRLQHTETASPGLQAPSANLGSPSPQDSPATSVSHPQPT